MLRSYTSIGKSLCAYSVRRRTHRLANQIGYPHPFTRRFFANDGAHGGKDDNIPRELIAQYGDDAPRHETVLCVPLTKKPIFPHFTASIIVKDETLAQALINTLSTSGNGGYIGLFYRNPKIPKQHSQEGAGATLAEEHENLDIITSAEDVHHVGTYAQITNYFRRDPMPQSAQPHSTNKHTQLHSTPPLTTQYEFVVVTHRRITVKNFLSFTSTSPSSVSADAPPSASHNNVTTAIVHHWPKTHTHNPDNETQLVKAYVNEIFQTIREWLAINPLGGEHIRNFFISHVDMNDPCKVADLAAAMTTASGEDLQQILEEENCEARLQLALALWTNEKNIAMLQKEINKQVETKMTKQQREYFLREQMKSIKQELGLEKDEKNDFIDQVNKKLQRYTAMQTPPKNFDKIVSVIQQQVDKLSTLDTSSAEYNVSKSYVEWLTSLPWDVNTQDLLNLAEAKKRLDADHFGLMDIKKRILEFIAVGVLRKKLTGKIMCFIGPPGVGKTSIAKSIAASLNRNFYRFSVGGLTDIAEIKGHRRTYIGAMPGKPIQALKSTGSINPLILIDEIDKLGRGHHGDPASALLELLDPNQNESFVDHYLDVPVDFSNVLFVCTANDEGSIPGPLRDRMEIIRLSGYDIPEKIAIANQYLVPKALRDAGFKDMDGVSITLSDETLETLIKNYCRESGVRNLERMIERLVHQLAYQYVRVKELAGKEKPSMAEPTVPHTETEHAHTHQPTEAGRPAAPTKVIEDWSNVEILPADLYGYLGKPKYSQDNIYESSGKSLPVGVVMGLAWNPLGGSPIFIETIATPVALSESGGNVHLMTGQLGNVMKESVNIAYTYARSFISQKFSENNFFKCHQIHLHCPEGAIEKDGPSAGTAMCVAFVSLALGKPVKPQVAMTGELSLTGRVLPIGGVKEKTLAARRTGANTIILPMSNKGDFDELPSYIKDAIAVHFVSDFADVYKICFEYDNSP